MLAKWTAYLGLLYGLLIFPLVVRIRVNVFEACSHSGCNVMGRALYQMKE